MLERRGIICVVAMNTLRSSYKCHASGVNKDTVRAALMVWKSCLKMFFFFS